MNKDAVELKPFPIEMSEEKGSLVGELIAINSEITKGLMKDPEPKQTPVSAQSYQRMTPEQKKLHFPVNRAMRRKQGIR
jgi:hypothetical protein